MKNFTLILLYFLIAFSLTACDIKSKQQESNYIREKELFEKVVRDKSQYIYELAKILSLDQDIIGIYQSLKKKVGDLYMINNENKAFFYNYGKELKEAFERKIRTYEKEPSFPVYYHFLLPPARSWLKPELPNGEDITLQDIGKIRPSIIDLQTKGTFLSGLEAIDNKLIYRTIMPIWGPNGEILGAVEVSSDYSNFIINYLQENPKKQIFIYLDKSLNNAFQNKKIFKNGILYYTNIEMKDADYENIFELLIEPKKQIHYKNKDYIIIPITDNNQQNLGYVLISLP